MSVKWKETTWNLNKQRKSTLFRTNFQTQLRGKQPKREFILFSCPVYGWLCKEKVHGFQYITGRRSETLFRTRRKGSVKWKILLRKWTWTCLSSWEALVKMHRITSRIEVAWLLQKVYWKRQRWQMRVTIFLQWRISYKFWRPLSLHFTPQ